MPIKKKKLLLKSEEQLCEFVIDRNRNLAETEMNRNLGYIILQPKPKPKFWSKSCRNLNILVRKKQFLKYGQKNTFTNNVFCKKLRYIISLVSRSDNLDEKIKLFANFLLFFLLI